MSQPQRRRAMSGFREGRFDILVATDIAARGIDVFWHVMCFSLVLSHGRAIGELFDEMFLNRFPSARHRFDRWKRRNTMSSDPYQRRIREVMVKDVVFVHGQDDVREALGLMVENAVTSLPVVDRRDRCVGVLSSTDFLDVTRELDEEISDVTRVSELSQQWLLEKLSEQGFERKTVKELMTNRVVTIGAEALLSEAAREMLRHRVHRLPVVDEKDRLMGIVSTMDLLQAFVDGAPR